MPAEGDEERGQNGADGVGNVLPRNVRGRAVDGLIEPPKEARMEGRAAVPIVCTSLAASFISSEQCLRFLPYSVMTDTGRRLRRDSTSRKMKGCVKRGYQSRMTAM